MDYQIVPKTHNHYFMLVISLSIFSLLPYCSSIVNRDLVLTPKQGLQLSGKRIFYEESFNNENNALHHNDSVETAGTRPWERTLKHVTYLTLFTNAANGIITGNFSKVKEYNEFLDSAYERSPKPIDSRFGDIVTLGQGRLETMSNGSYRFVEGNCDYECARESNIIAMWHVQKIRHRETADRKYHYEMKFSVSPMTAKVPTETVVRGGPNKRTIMEERRNNVQTFIQKEDDYPNSFRKIVSDKDEDFSERRNDAARNFRHVNPHYTLQQVTPIPQSTFLRGIYHHPPPQNSVQLQRPHVAQQHSVAHAHPQVNQAHHHQHQQLPLPERLNIGEFYKGNYVPKTTSKGDLIPNLLNMFLGKPQHSLTPSTTFRPPSNQMKFPRPEIYTFHQHSQQEFSKFPEYQHFPLLNSHEHFNQRTPTPVPLVTHHYHHHFFMPNNSAITIEQAIQPSGEQNQNTPAELYHNEVTEVTAPQGYVTNLFEEPHASTTVRQPNFPRTQHQVQTNYHPNLAHQNLQSFHSNYHVQQVVPPAPQKFIFPNTQIEQQRVIHVTPAPPLRKPHYTQQTQYTQQQQYYENRPFSSSLEYTTVHVPLLISYPAPTNEEERADVPTPRSKPFLQSDPIENNIRYSEPDPLYANVNEGESGNENKFILNREHQHQERNPEPQLESPEHYDQPQNNQQQHEEADSKKEHSESIEAQVPAPNDDARGTEDSKTVEETKQNIPEQSTSQSLTLIQISHDKTNTKSIKTEASNSIVATTKRPKIFAMRKKRISLKTATTTSSTSTTENPTTSTLKPTTTESPKSSTTSKPRKTFVSTSSTESPLRTISRYRNSYAKTSSTSTTTTEKPVLKWTPKRKAINTKFMTVKSTTPVSEIKIEKEKVDESDDKDDSEENNDNEDFKTNESNNLRISKPSLLNTTTAEFVLKTTTELSNVITTSISSTMATLSSSSSPSPPALLSQISQDETEIYEVLTQKSVSKSVSLKVGNNGEEIPVIVDDKENEVKTV